MKQTEGTSAQASVRTDELSGKLTENSSLLFEVGRYAVPLAVIITLVHSLVLTIKQIDGPSMLPSFQSGERTIVDRRDWIDYTHGDVVILRYPGDPANRQYIKRIVAIPGDSYAIRSGSVFVNGVALDEPYLAPGTSTKPDVAQRTLAASEYFTLGDNRPVSNDSRFFGPVHRRYIIGKVVTTLATLNLPF